MGIVLLTHFPQRIYGKGKEKQFSTLPMLAWCERKKILEMCIGFTCPHFGSE